MNGPVVLIVLDGFGIGDGGPADATARAHAPFLAGVREQYPCSELKTSGEAVGLPPGQMGNSEVGHMTIGAGRVILQNITQISRALEAGELATNPAIQDALRAVESSGGRLHLMGLVSDGGVHSHIDHLARLLEYLGERSVPPTVHAFLDGRDTPPRSALGFIRTLQSQVAAVDGHIATVTGRYYAMDRDNRWERVSRAYHAIVCGEGATAPDAVTAVEDAYSRDENDEFALPTIVGEPTPVADGDAIIFFNFRADRARELTAALTSSLPHRFEGELERQRVPRLCRFVCFTNYDEQFELPIAFPTPIPANSLGEIVARQGLQQLRIAETEKYAHVTFFFNGGLETPFPGEDRALIASPRDVATYDHKPEMSAFALTDEILRRLTDKDYGFVLLNYANPDMVGHTGMLDAAIKAVETVDRGLERIARSVLASGGAMLVTADHGNCELMVDPESGEPHTAHTTNPVPLHWIARDTGTASLRDGALSDLAPTVLDLMGLPQPEEMSGRSLIVRD